MVFLAISLHTPPSKPKQLSSKFKKTDSGEQAKITSKARLREIAQENISDTVKKVTGKKDGGKPSPSFSNAVERAIKRDMARRGGKYKPGEYEEMMMRIGKEFGIFGDVKGKKDGGKPIPEGPEGAGLRALKAEAPEVVSEMGYKKKGGIVEGINNIKGMKNGGVCRGMGAATKGGSFNVS